MKYIVAIFTVLIFCGAFGFTVNAQSNKQKDRPLKIKSKPQAVVEGCRQAEGITKVRVTFDKSAKIANVELISSSGCENFDKNSVKAAKGIKFEPEIKNGETITVTKRIEYAFALY